MIQLLPVAAQGLTDAWHIFLFIVILSTVEGALRRLVEVYWTRTAHAIT